MKIIRGFKIGGLQQKLFNMMLIMILALIGAYVAVSAYQQTMLTKVVQEASASQQDAITSVSEETMEAVVESTMNKSTALQAYIADDLFADMQTRVLVMRECATQIFAHDKLYIKRMVSPPSASDDGIPVAQLIHEEGAEPGSSELLGLMGNMSDLLLAVYRNSDQMSSCFVGTADGNMVLVNDRPGTFVSDDGSPHTLEIRNRPWFRQAAAAGELIFTDVEIDAYTENPMIECAAPVYWNGELAAVVAADIYLTSISDYVERAASEGGFACVISDKGQVLFAPSGCEIFHAEFSGNGPDLRQDENAELANFIKDALAGDTGIRTILVDGKEYYMAGAPMKSVGWTVVSVVDKEVTRQPTDTMLARYAGINKTAREAYAKSAKTSEKTFLVLSVFILLVSVFSALHVAKRIVRPLETMTNRINSLKEGDTAFEMEDAYRTGDEIEVLAESFATMSQRTRDYIEQITKITAEKERIGTELALATRIQADMLPNIYPAFPDRPEFDIYATMDPAKEVGGDFYDFFLLDDDHLGVVMADVSGKGVPAALFMMVSKILVQNYAMTGLSPGEVLEAVNNQICPNNREDMFVTVWFGVLDIKTGEITAANAGHEFPALMQAGGSFELIKNKHSFVIGGMEGIKYKEFSLMLTPGSKLFLYTDGVPEATNAENELFGTDRMLEALNTDTSADPEAVLGNLRKAVDAFVKEAEQFDDLTMLCLEYKGVNP